MPFGSAAAHLAAALHEKQLRAQWPMKTITIPLAEYLELQRLVGFAQSITNEKYVTHYKETPHDDVQWHHPVTSRWRESLVTHAERCEKRAHEHSHTPSGCV